MINTVPKNTTVPKYTLWERQADLSISNYGTRSTWFGEVFCLFSQHFSHRAPTILWKPRFQADSDTPEHKLARSYATLLPPQVWYELESILKYDILQAVCQFQVFQPSNSTSLLADWLSHYWQTVGGLKVQVPGTGMQGIWLWLNQGRQSAAFTLACCLWGCAALWRCCASHRAHSAVLCVCRGRTENWNKKQQQCVCLPVCCTDRVYSFAMTGITTVLRSPDCNYV